MPIPTENQLAEARSAAVAANILARDAESKARKLRKDADSKQACYDTLLREANFMSIDDDPDFQQANPDYQEA